MKKKIILLGILLVILGIMGVGCYTVLTHTRVQGEGEEGGYTGQYYREHCTDCHQDYHNFPYGFYYGYYPNYYFNYPRWGHYYAYPWWWDRYWGEDYNNDNGGTSEPESAEKAERRRGLEPPYVRPETNPATPFIPPTSTKGDESTQIKPAEKPKAIQIEEPKKDQKEEKSDKPKAERRRKE